MKTELSAEERETLLDAIVGCIDGTDWCIEDDTEQQIEACLRKLGLLAHPDDGRRDTKSYGHPCAVVGSYQGSDLWVWVEWLDENDRPIGAYNDAPEPVSVDSLASFR